MISFDISLAGFKELDRTLKQVGDLGEEILFDEVRAGSEYLLKKLQAAAPAKTGLTRRALTIRETISSTNHGKHLVCSPQLDVQRFPQLIVRTKDGRNVAYPVLVEYGKPGAMARPWMRPTWKRSRRRIETKAINNAWRRIRQAAERLGGVSHGNS